MKELQKVDSSHNLPICPKCNETKFVRCEQTDKMNSVIYICEKCRVYWYGVYYD